MKKYEPTKIDKRLDVALIVTMLLTLLGLFTMFFFIKFAFLFIVGLPLSLIFGLTSKWISKKDEYTREFLKYMRKRIDDSFTLEGLKSVMREFEELAIEGRTYRLSFPSDLRRIHVELLNKIEILEKQQVKSSFNRINER